MSRTLSPSPAVTMQVTTKTKTVTLATLSRTSATLAPHRVRCLSRIRTPDSLVIRHPSALAVLFVPKPALDGMYQQGEFPLQRRPAVLGQLSNQVFEHRPEPAVYLHAALPKWRISLAASVT